MTSATQTVNNELKELRKNRKAEYLRTMKAFEEKLSRLEKSLVEKFTTENTIESFLTPTKKEIVKREIQKIKDEMRLMKLKFEEDERLDNEEQKIFNLSIKLAQKNKKEISNLKKSLQFAKLSSNKSQIKKITKNIDE
jgi:hypothetical protein